MSAVMASGRVRAAVRAFLSERLSDSDSDDQGTSSRKRPLSSVDSDEEPAELTPATLRPSRLGLGAVFNTDAQKPELSEVDRRVLGRIRAESSREAARQADGELKTSFASDEDYDPDSRAAKLLPKKKTSKKKKVAHRLKSNDTILPRVEERRPNSNKELVKFQTDLSSAKLASSPAKGKSDLVTGRDSTTLQSTERPPKKPKDISHEIVAREVMIIEAPTSKARNASSGQNDVDVENDTALPSRTKKKTRSRRKNLRRDTRPPHKLPPHLTPETLKRRLKRDKDGPEECTSPWFVDRSSSGDGLQT